MDLFLISPEISLVCLGLLLIALDLITGGRTTPAAEASGQGEDKTWLGYLALAGLVVPAALLIVIAMAGQGGQAFLGTFVLDTLALFFKGTFLIAAALVLLASLDYVRRQGIPEGEFYGLVLFATAGLMLMASARELITIYIALETATISFILLSGFNRRDLKSNEASLKYILLNATASATLLYGMALLYGLTGSTYLDGIARGLTTINPVTIMGLVLVTAGLGFKVAAVPFHMWVPDVYEGAPTPITAFLSVGSKAAGFVLAVRVFTVAFTGPTLAVWPDLIAVLSALTMTLGNVVAMRQDNIKRLLAYSSITQAGYVLMGVAAASSGATSALAFFLLAYTFTNLGAFIVIIAFFNQVGSDEISAYSGLSRRAPLMALVLALCVLSLAGIPPMVGFAGKVYLFWSVFQEQRLWWLVLIGLLNSAASIFYYLRVVRAMYTGEPADGGPVVAAGPARVAMLLATAGMLVLGVVPWQAIELSRVAAASLFP